MMKIQKHTHTTNEILNWTISQSRAFVVLNTSNVNQTTFGTEMFKQCLEDIATNRFPNDIDTILQ